MDWIQFLQVICLPAFGWLFYKLGDLRKEITEMSTSLSEFKIEVAKDKSEYVKREDIVRIESKIDELRNLVIKEIKK